MRRSVSAGQRDLRTVLFTDIVGSTEAAARLGDRAWADVLARHHRLVRAALRRTDGREEDTAGDGFFATFARPTAALACAVEIERAVAGLGLVIRVGLHAGEVQHQDGKAAGITVHLAARLMAAAQPDEVLASATVRELAAGAGWTFVDRGPLELKGLAEPVHAYALDLAAAPAIVPGPAPLGLISRAPASAILAATTLVLVVVAVLAFRLVGGSADPAASPSPVALGSSVPAGLAGSLAAGSPGASPSLDEKSALSHVEVAPDLYVDLDPGWRVTDSAFLRQSSPEDKMFIYAGSFVLAADPCGYKPGIILGTDPETGFVAWARANKGLTLSPSDGTLRRFADLSTTEFDVGIVPKYACPITSPISVALTPGIGNTLLDLGTRLRFEIGSWNGHLVLIGIQTPSGTDFDSFDALAEKVLNTMQFTP